MKSLLVAIVLSVFIGGSTANASLFDEITDPDMIYEAQRVMYERNFGSALNFPDGVIGPKTREMIRKYEAGNDLDVTGELSELLHDILILEGIDDSWKWAAIGASVDGAYSSHWNYPSREEAARKAINGCRSRSADPDHCIVVTTFDMGDDDEGWLTAITCERRFDNSRHTHVVIAAGLTKDRAIDNAYERAADNGYNRNRCRERVSIAVDGSHE